MVRVAACPPDGYPEGNCRFLARAPARPGSMELRIAGLPDATRLYPAHEYTLSNARFCADAAPDDTPVAERLAAVEALRAEGRMTLPTTVAEERATNLFVRAGTVEEFARLRAAKDSFR